MKSVKILLGGKMDNLKIVLILQAIATMVFAYIGNGIESLAGVILGFFVGLLMGRY